MKNKLLIILFLFPLFIFAQKNLTLNFNTTAAGRNFTIDYAKKINNKNEIGVGLRIIVNSIAHPDDQFKVFYKRQFATEFFHTFGLNSFYHHSILPRWKTVKPFLFFDMQLSYSKTWNRFFTPFASLPDGRTLYLETRTYFGPYFWHESIVGLGYKADINSSFFIVSKIGFETMLIFGREDKLLSTWRNTPIREFGYLFNFGIGYRL